MYRIEQELPSPEEYQALRSAVGWTSPSTTACRQALDSSAFGVVARQQDRAVGMARLVGDVTMYLFLVDIAVTPEHQGAGLGRRMVNALLDWTEDHDTRTTMLIASADVAPFYNAFGFSLDPSHAMKRTSRRRRAN
ncbi:GNAT family N-acetyltransferase [Streptomyces sp. WMMC500]|uniref:GNAT family N-acetyltransferase n=1 Tax=Streptomyces sp. WMMC500 TaxID=3015154 RepID=UPI00248CF855|nr:GNAT family N-acetyltransferase [Streptomyces sp. WMMC500]WBB64085.1 GNAT family N-acetyltransferase [Streptomyces sp. WMMC500]